MNFTERVPHTPFEFDLELTKYNSKALTSTITQSLEAFDVKTCNPCVAFHKVHPHNCFARKHLHSLITHAKSVANSGEMKCSRCSIDTVL